MKTSHILLAIITVVTLTGLVATNVLLKRQYEQTDWSNPFQDFTQQALPTVRHWVVTGNPTAEIIIEQQAKPQALVKPDLSRYYSIRQRGDTAFVKFTLDYTGESNPRAMGYELPAGLLLYLPDLQSLRVHNGRVTLRKFAPDQLAIQLQHSRLRTSELTIRGPFSLTAQGYSEAILGADRYTSFQAAVQDSSGMQLTDTQAETFTSNVSPDAEIQLRGKALKWLK